MSERKKPLTAKEYVDAFRKGKTPSRIYRTGKFSRKCSNIVDVEKRLDKFANKKFGI